MQGLPLERASGDTDLSALHFLHRTPNLPIPPCRYVYRLVETWETPTAGSAEDLEAAAEALRQRERVAMRYPIAARAASGAVKANARLRYKTKARSSRYRKMANTRRRNLGESGGGGEEGILDVEAEAVPDRRGGGGGGGGGKASDRFMRYSEAEILCNFMPMVREFLAADDDEGGLQAFDEEYGFVEDDDGVVDFTYANLQGSYRCLSLCFNESAGMCLLVGLSPIGDRIVLLLDGRGLALALIRMRSKERHGKPMTLSAGTHHYPLSTPGVQWRRAQRVPHVRAGHGGGG